MSRARALAVPSGAGHRLRLSADVAAGLQAFHLQESKRHEAMCIAFGHGYLDVEGRATVVLSSLEDVRFLGPDCFDRQSSHAVVLSSEVAAGINYEAVQRGHTAIVNLHDHWFARHASFSAVDDAGDLAEALQHARTISRFTPPDRPMIAASMLVAKDDWDARVVWAADRIDALSRMRVDVVDVIDRCLSREPQETPLPPRFARHGGVISARSQRRIADLHAVVVGCGGTGSVVAEILARTGFGRIGLIDMDRIEASNLNRLQCATPEDVGRLKVDVVCERTRAIAPTARIETVAAPVFAPESVRLLEQADVVLGCVDNHETRWWLNRFAVQYMVPWFDCAVLIDTQAQPVMFTRTSAVIPGRTACGHCSPIEFFPRQRPQAFEDETTRTVMRGAGYFEGAGRSGDGDATVYPLTLQAAAWLTQNLLDWIAGLRGVAHSIFHRSDRPVIERIEVRDFDGLRPEGCPVCDVLLGRCRTERLATHHDSASSPALPTDLLEQDNNHGIAQS